MASDEVVWQVINQEFCAFKLKTTKAQTFCRNEYNVTGLCNRQSCPLANSRYATIRSNPESGALYLCMKTIERAHLPNKLWERLRLSNNYSEALEQIDEHLKYWPKYLIHKCKQRLTRLTQVAIRTKRLAKEADRLGERTVQKMAPKIRRREAIRERKAEAAAKVERKIELELLDRLRSGAYGDRPLNVEEGIWQKVLRGLERGGEGTRDRDLDKGVEYEMQQDLEDGAVEYVSDIGEDSDEEDVGELEDWLGGDSPDEDSEGDSAGSSEGSKDTEASDSEKEKENKISRAVSNVKRKRPANLERPDPRKPKRKGKGPKMEIEYEYENASAVLAA